MTQSTIELINHHNGTVSLKLIGNFDSKNAPTIFSSEFDPLLENLRTANAQKVIVDLAFIEWLDERGLSFLIRLKQRLAGQNTQVVLRNLDSRLKHVLRIMQFEQIFVIENDPD